MRFPKLIAGLVLLMVVMEGCATTKVPASLDASRADATVTMGYSYGSFEKPEVDWDKAEVEALRICENWGYVGVDAFGAGIRECVSVGSYGCNRWVVTTKYQCLDSVLEKESQEVDSERRTES